MIRAAWKLPSSSCGNSGILPVIVTSICMGSFGDNHQSLFRLPYVCSSYLSIHLVDHSRVRGKLLIAIIVVGYSGPVRS